VLGDPADGVLGTNVLGAYDVTDVPNVVQMSIRRGRTSLDQTFAAGTGTVVFEDRNGDWNPDNTLSPFYGQLVPGIQLTMRVTRNLTNYSLFSGYIRSYDYTWDIGDPYARVTLTATDALYLFNLAEVDTVAGAAAGDLPGARINQLLDELEWPASARNINPGTVTLQNDPGDARQLLAALQTVTQTDLGALFIDVAGRVTFLDRAGLSARATGTAVAFRDTGTDLEYQQIDYAFDDDQIINQAVVTRSGGTAQTATDAASVTQYFKRSTARSGLLMEDDARALQQANAIVANRAQPKLRINSIGFLVIDVDRFNAATGVEFGDPIIVEKDYNGTPIELRSTVQGIAHTINPTSWTTTFSTAEPLSYAFVLGSNEFGILGVNTL
jgi:hypothetical protein